MKIRFGYVAMAIDLKDSSPSRTISYTNYKKIEDEEVKLYRLKKITEENLINTRRILLYNIAHNIKVYRLTSKLVPLVTHPDVIKWDYIKEFTNIYREISNLITENSLRISAHPDHFTILSSPRHDVVESSIIDLEYHNSIMESFGLSPTKGKLVLHIGGKYKGKDQTLKRFKETYHSLSESIRNRIIVENDDKVYTITDVLEVCEDIKTPMVVDVHHHWCNNNGENIDNYLERIFNTWNHQELKPKVHISSPKSSKDIRAHADNIDFNFFYNFIKSAKEINRDFDIMIEAKNKNIALFNLMKDIEKNKKFKIIDNATIEV